MPVSLTPEEKDKLLKGLTKYASEGANDDQLRKFRDAFISELKKKGGGQPVSGADVERPGKPSAPSFGQKVVNEAITEDIQVPLRGQQKPPVTKKPYQDIYYKPEALPSETTQTVETPVIKAAKQDFKQTQIKPIVKPPVTEQGIKELEQEIKQPDKTFLKFQDYQTSIDDLDELENLYDEDLSNFQFKLSRRPDLYAKYSGRTEQETIDFFNALNDPNELRRNEAQAQFDVERNALYENFVNDYKSLKSKHGKIASELDVMTDGLTDELVNEKNYKKFMAKREFALTPTGAETSFGEVVNIDEVDKVATEVVDNYGLPTDGDAWRLMKNKIKAKVFNEYMKPRVEEELKRTKPDLLAKRQQIFEEGFKVDDDIYAKTDAVLTTLQNEYEQEAKKEMDLINSEYEGRSKQLNQNYEQYNKEIERQQLLLNNMYKAGQIDQLGYESAFNKLEDDKKAYHAEYEKNFPNFDEYVKKSNEINSRYNRKFEIQKKILTDKAQAELEIAYKKYAETYQEDPKILEELNNAYKEAYDAVAKRDGEIIKMGASMSMNPVSSLYNSTMSAMGGVFKGWGGSIDNKSLELLGETMEQNFYMPAAKTEDFSDWTDLQNLSMITGQVAGSMGPSMIPTAAAAVGVAFATGGLGLPASATVVTSGLAGALAGWGAETIDTAGRAYLDVFERSGGDVARANEAAKRSVKSQYDIMWSYSFEALPFIGKALKFVPTQVGRIGVGAAVELGTEFTQEIRQGIAEENIVELERDPWTNFDEAINDERRRKQTLVSIGPVAIMGGAGQIGSKSIQQERRDAYIAQQQKSVLSTALPDQRRQYIQNMVFNRNGKFANTVIASLYASGKIDERESANLMLEIKRAEQIKEAGKSAGLSGSKLNIYGFYSARAEEAERNAGRFAADPILSKSYQDMAKQYRDAGVEFMNGGSPDLLTLTYADGSQAMMLPEDVNALFADPIALSLLNKNAISIEAYNEKGEGPKIIEELKGRAETYAKKNRYTQASEIASPMQTLRQNINQRIKELYAEQVELTEKQKRQEAERITQEETAAFEQKEKERQQEERGQRDIEIERLQQQRMAIGVNDIDAFFSDMKPLVATTVERLEQGKNAPQSAIKVASDYLYAKYKELTAMKSDPNRMMTIAQIESVQAQIEQDLQTLAGNPPSQKIQVNDQENIQGVSGEVGVGQEPVETQPIEVPSTEEAPAGGILQAQGQEEVVTPQVTEEPAPKPARKTRLAKMFGEEGEGETTVKISETAPAVRRVGAVEASEGSNEDAGIESALEGVGLDETKLEDWKRKNKAPSKKGRIEELTQAVRDLMSGKIKFKEYYEKAKQLIPSKSMEKVPTPASFEEVVGSIDKNKLKIGIINLNKFVKKGMNVGLRIDIPAFNNFGKNVVTVHDRTGSGQPVIGYGSTGSISNVKFRTSVSTAAKIGAGEQKSAFAMAEGQWMDESPESIQKRAEEALNSPEWVQVGMNPTRNSFFFDKADGNPVVAADEVLQVGNLVLAKNPQKIDLNTKEGMAQFEKQFSAKTKEGVTYQYRTSKPSPGERIGKIFETSDGEEAVPLIEQALSESGIKVEVKNDADYNNDDRIKLSQGSGSEGMFVADDGTIILNRDKIKGEWGKTIVFHEGIHPVINIIRNTDPKRYRAIVDGLKEEAARNTEVAKAAADIAASEEYQRRGPESIEDETIVETMARVATGDVDINTFKPSFREKFIEFMNDIAKVFGIRRIALNSQRMEVKRLADQINKMLNEGGKVSDVVGKKNVKEFQNKIILDDTNSVFSNTSSQARFEMRFLEDSEDFAKLIEEGRVVHNASLDDINGETVVIHNPDNFSTGDIKFRGKDLVKGEGGVYFVLLYNDVWASGKKSSASQLAALINESLQKSTDGKGRLVLVKGDASKNLTSVKGAKALMGVMEILADDGLIPLSAFRKALNIAGKKYGINFDGRNDAKSIHKDIQDKFMNVSNSSFERRGDFVRDVIDAIADQNVLSKEAIAEIAESIGAKRKMTTFSKASILDSVAYATSERMLRDIPNSHVYAVIETSSKVKPEFIGKHESYPWHIVTEDGSKPILYILKDRPFYNDAFVAAKSTEKVKEGERFGDISRAGLAQRGMGLAKVDTKTAGQPSIDIKRTGKYEALPGAPTLKDATGPIPELVDVAESYAKKFGVPYTRQAEYVQVDEDFAKSIAKAYEEMKHNPTDPKVKEAYDDLIRQTTDQYNALTEAGYEFTFFDGETDPYNGNPVDAMRDLRANKKMAVYGTYAGYGTGSELNIGLDDPSGGPRLSVDEVLKAVKKAGGEVISSSVYASDTEPTLVVKLKTKLDDKSATKLSTDLGQESIAQRFDDETGKIHGPQAEKWGEFDPKFFITSDGRRASETSNPMLEDTGLQWPDQNGEMHKVTANDLFRAVYDAFGHGLEGAGFRARGEENAWQAHARLFTGPAVAAITTETRGQNSWLNYGPYGEQNRKAKVQDTIFAEQKTGLMPEWTWTENVAPPMEESKEGVKGQPSMVKRTPAQIRQAVEDGVDAVEEAIADGMDPQQAVDENISNQDWYGDLSATQKEQLNEILQDEFGVTASEPKLQNNAQRVADLWEKGGKEAKAEIKNILETDPELSYIYNNFPKITKQLQEQGLLTKTENCP